MTTTEQEKIDSRLRCVLLELSIIRQEFRKNRMHACADSITEAANHVEIASGNSRKGTPIFLDKERDAYEAQPTK